MTSPVQADTWKVMSTFLIWISMNLHVIYKGPVRLPLLITTREWELFFTLDHYPLLVCCENDHVTKQASSAGSQTVFTSRGSSVVCSSSQYKQQLTLRTLNVAKYNQLNTNKPPHNAITTTAVPNTLKTYLAKSPTLQKVKRLCAAYLGYFPYILVKAGFQKSIKGFCYWQHIIRKRISKGK